MALNFSNKNLKSLARIILRPLLRKRLRFIIDYQYNLGKFNNKNQVLNVELVKEEISRKYVLDNIGHNLNFLDIGAMDGKLKYLLGIKKNLKFYENFYDKNKKLFDLKYNYYGADINPNPHSEKVLYGDICNANYLNSNTNFTNFFDVVYSNNVFEHLTNPFIAAKNISKLLKPGGLVITIAPFSLRYHKCPGDYFRFTHQGLEVLFSEEEGYETIVSGYDIQGRRNNWQGHAEDNNDYVPVDQFGAWRENWFVINISKKFKNIN